jgi:nucleoside 2-deoxyribosyltransferase/DNA-directed RNA polymerase subunit RPC12/RpoP
MAYSCLICGYEATDSTPNSQTHTIRCPTCGSYTLTRAAGEERLKKLDPDDRIRLCWLTRETHEAGGRLAFDSESIKKYLAIAPHRVDPLEAMSRILLLLADRTKSAEQSHRVDRREFGAVRSTSSAEMTHLWVVLEKEGLVEGNQTNFPTYRLTPKGWSRVSELRQRAVLPRQTFVAMWFDPGMDEAYEKGFVPAIREAGYDPKRIDRIEHNDIIDDRMIAEIRRSGLVVADYTDNRRGVYFEAGFAMGLGIPVISTCRRDHFKDLHFDVEHRNHVVWDKPEDLLGKLRARIEALYPRRGAPLAS